MIKASLYQNWSSYNLEITDFDSNKSSDFYLNKAGPKPNMSINRSSDTLVENREKKNLYYYMNIEKTNHLAIFEYW